MEPNESSAIERLQNGDEPARLAAAQWLAQRPTAHAAVALVGAVADNSDEVRQWAAEALENLGPPAAVQLPDLLQYARSENDDQAYWAATLIGRVGTRSHSARAALSELAANHRSASVRQRAQWALKSIEATSL